MSILTALLIAGLLAAAQAGEPSLETVMARAGAYVAAYYEKLTAIVSEERYVQRATRGTFEIGQIKRELRSDFVIVRGFARDVPWLALRDVLEVDGKAVEGERGRIAALLEAPLASTPARVRALADQQSKYNLGEIYRTINVPTLPLEYLLGDRQRRFRFRKTGTAVVDGRSVSTVSYEERHRPTLIRTPAGDDVVSRGVMWIEPLSGEVVRTELRAGEKMQRRIRSVITVHYARIDKFDLLLPVAMHERYLTGTSQVEADASYSNFRRFETQSRIKPPASDLTNQAVSIYNVSIYGHVVRR